MTPRISVINIPYSSLEEDRKVSSWGKRIFIEINVVSVYIVHHSSFLMTLYHNVNFLSSEIAQVTNCILKFMKCANVTA